MSITLNVPLQPVPQSSPQPDRRAALEQELKKLTDEESGLINDVKDWITKLQGDETKKQALERELFALDRAAAAAPTPEQIQATLQKQRDEAEAKLKELVKQQKIEEKKAFDRYSAGDIDRQGLLDEMERIRQNYATGPAAAASTSTPVSTATPSTLMKKLLTLPELQQGMARQLLIDLPNQGTVPTIERSADGNGIIITSGSSSGFLADADLLRAGATAEDIISLPISQQSSAAVTPLIPPSPAA